MANFYKNEKILHVKGYEVYFTRFSDSILLNHFPNIMMELESILDSFFIKESQIIASGGGLSSMTQALANALRKKGWPKLKIQTEQHARGVKLISESHEVDHYLISENGNIGLEIEWNNKDPFYDRDLENFRKLHQIGELSLGIIITRGASLQGELSFVFRRFLESLYPFDVDKIREHISLSDKAKKAIKEQIVGNPEETLDKVSKFLCASKFGKATTHMDKLLTRIDRGLGNPCPLILIGIGKERLIK